MRGATIRRSFRPAPVEPLREQYAPPSRIARQLALAHHIEELIDSGGVTDYAQAAQQLGITRARLTQIANLLLLAPFIQERLVEGSLSASERDLRPVTKQPNWQTQAAGFIQQEADQ